MENERSPIELSDKEIAALIDFIRNDKLSLGEIIMFLNGMAEKANCFEYAALTQAVEYLKQIKAEDKNE